MPSHKKTTHPTLHFQNLDARPFPVNDQTFLTHSHFETSEAAACLFMFLEDLMGPWQHAHKQASRRLVPFSMASLGDTAFLQGSHNTASISNVLSSSSTSWRWKCGKNSSVLCFPCQLSHSFDAQQNMLRQHTPCNDSRTKGMWLQFLITNGKSEC